ncbi:hypothetical protein BCR34DRAFT_385988 [Clohesyomyces aquaticus]|uniref:Secreted protein n=1 Tax=Clohesyomyces aquaticus TaxID=1231657 RepID=A0A1Y1ZGH0_9PLEO|nr:hypothetical protein BCR34DRAFT_385988 [Clohesyomyces aquaticus]
MSPPKLSLVAVLTGPTWAFVELLQRQPFPSCCSGLWLRSLLPGVPRTIVSLGVVVFVAGHRVSDHRQRWTVFPKLGGIRLLLSIRGESVDCHNDVLSAVWYSLYRSYVLA